MFSMRQEAGRKCAAREFAVLTARFAIIERPSGVWYNEDVNDILSACVIMHNMIVELRKDNYFFDGAGGLRGVVSSQIIPIHWNDLDATTTSRTTAIQSMRSSSDHARLKNALGRYIASMLEER